MKGVELNIRQLWHKHVYSHSTHSPFIQSQSPLHHPAPFPWGQSAQDSATWFPQLTSSDVKAVELNLENNQSVMGFYILISLPTDKGVLQVPWPLQSPSVVHWKTNKEWKWILNIEIILTSIAKHQSHICTLLRFFQQDKIFFTSSKCLPSHVFPE